MELRALTPWWTRIVAKLVLSRLGIPYALWRKLGVFKHGEMERPERALSVFQSHYYRASKIRPLPKDFVVLELGPGDSLATSVVSWVHGATGCFLVDAGNFAHAPLAAYNHLVDFLNGRQVGVRRCGRFGSVQDVLASTNSQYLTQGLASLRSIPDQTVDFIFSDVVLEHVRVAELQETICELRRILKKDGVSSHSVDLRDHLGGSLNNLRFRPTTWESRWMSRSGFYTNRIRFQRMLEMFQAAGFMIVEVSKKTWPELPTKRARMHKEFCSLPEADLLICEFSVVIVPQ